MSICVTTLYTKEIEEVGRITEQNHRAYCAEHGYEYNSHFGRISDRHPSWDKVLAVLRLLPHYDHVMWVDADCVFNNFGKKIENYLGKCGTFCRDINSNESNMPCFYVNAGVFILKRDQKSFDLLGSVWNNANPRTEEIIGLERVGVHKRSYHGWPWEQCAFSERLLGSDDFMILEDKDMNRHPDFATPESFIIHYMGWRVHDGVERDWIGKMMLAPGVKPFGNR